MKSLSLEDFLRRQAARLQDVPDDFIEQVGAAQQQIFQRITMLLSRLERDGDDILQTKKNVRIADEIRESLPGIMESSKYFSAITAFVAEFENQKKLIDSFLSTEFADKIKSKFADAVLEQSKRNAVEIFASQTVTTKFLDGIRNQIDLAVQSGQSFTETVTQLRTYALGDSKLAGAPIAGRDKPGGKLLQYSKQVAYDAMATADRAYTNAVISDLEPEWFLFAGGLMPTSRQFCMDKAGKYFHRNEIIEWAHESWAGKMENTTEANIFVVLGGHNCQHTLIPVTIERVPADVVSRNIANGNYKPDKKEAKTEKVKEATRAAEKEPEPPAQPKEIPPPSPDELKSYYDSFGGEKYSYDNKTFGDIGDVFEYYKDNFKTTTVRDTLDGFDTALKELAYKERLVTDEGAVYYGTLRKQLDETSNWMTENLPLRARKNRHIYAIDETTNNDAELVKSKLDKLPFTFEETSSNGSIQTFATDSGDIVGLYRMNLSKELGTFSRGKTVLDAYKLAGTFAHEYGHFVDSLLSHELPVSIKRMANGKVRTNLSRFATESNSPIMKRLMDAIESSPEIKKINEQLLRATQENEHYDMDFLFYLNVPRERFARAFSQYVATRSENNMMLKALRADPDRYPDWLKGLTQWSDKSFEPIAKEFDKLFEALR